VTVDQTDALLRGLTEAQRLAVLSDAAPLSVLAGAGSGKTTVLTRRVARRLFDGSASAEHSLVVTFTRKASRELRGRLWRLHVPGPVWAGTFHAAAYRQLRRHWADTGVRGPSVIDDPRRLLRRVVDSPEVAAADDTLGAVLAEIQWAQARLVAPADYAAAARVAGRRTPLGVDQIADLYLRYVEAKQTHGVIDLNDLLTRAAEVLERDTAVAAASRWRIRHLFVDEFQDVNPAQWRLLGAWLQGRTDLFVVGDPRQAVYGWNGADPTLLDRLPTLLPGTTVLRLDANHRSSPQVIAAARAVLHGADGSDRVDTVPDGPVSDVPVSDGPVPDGREGRPDGPVPTISGFDDDTDEANAIARWLRVMHRPGRPWSHLAVLARTNARLTPVAEALKAAGIPYRLGPAARTGTTWREAVISLRAMPAHRSLRSALADLSVPDAGGTGGRRAKPGGIPSVLARLADEHAVEDPGATVAAFLAWLVATVGDGDRAEIDPDTDAVELTTFHRAKGLEWPAVALVGLEDGLVPISYATSAAARLEERRLLYVAVTRAEEHLWCSWAAHRHVSDKSWTCRPSPLLAAIEAAGTTSGRGDDPTDFAAHIASLRNRLPVAG
jgi:DNA helicase II / ATP-dependent DNA helicase PcrA